MNCFVDNETIHLCLLLGFGVKQDDLYILHCTTEYPALISEVNLAAMDTIAAKTGCKVGYSDHTMGDDVTIAAAAMGAVVLEKHFTLDRTLPGPDHPASLEPDELKQMVISVRNIQRAIGKGTKELASAGLDLKDPRGAVGYIRYNGGVVLSPPRSTARIML